MEVKSGYHLPQQKGDDRQICFGICVNKMRGINQQCSLCVHSGWFGLNHVGKSWFWWAKLYWEPSKENFRFKKIMCWKGTISPFGCFFGNFFLMHFSFPALWGLQTHWHFIFFVVGSEPMDWSGRWSRSSQCIQGAYNNIY